MPGFIEADYENSIIELFQNMGYQYMYGPLVERDYRSPLYDEILVDSLHRINPSLPDAALADALYKLTNFENGTLIQKNKTFMNYLQNGIEVSYHDKGETKSDIVYLADYRNADNNVFMIVNQYIKEAYLLHQALSLCSALTEESERMEAAFFEAVRVMANRILIGGGKSTLSLKELNDRVNELLKQSIKSDGVINLFDGVKEEFSLFDPKFLEEISNMKQKNLAVELLKKLIAEQISIYRRSNVVKSEKFSEMIQRVMNEYLNGLLTNQQVIDELMKMAKDIRDARQAGNDLGLTEEEMAFYDALTKPEAIKDFYENSELVALTKELTETLRKNKTIDWQKRDTARAKMRMMIKKLLKKYKYPPEGMDDALETVMVQCELWTDNNDMGDRVNAYVQAFTAKSVI